MSFSSEYLLSVFHCVSKAGIWASLRCELLNIFLLPAQKDRQTPDVRLGEILTRARPGQARAP